MEKKTPRTEETKVWCELIKTNIGNSAKPYANAKIIFDKNFKIKLSGKSTENFSKMFGDFPYQKKSFSKH